jgi:cobyrinic acid a,c-diamide synthase
MFLCHSIRHREKLYPMAGVFPFQIALGTKPQGHGYTIMECVGPNPFFRQGTVVRGHEFHYSRIADQLEPGAYPFVFRLRKGHGIVAGCDGLCYKNVLASYSHLHAVGCQTWADALIRAAGSHQRLKTTFSADSAPGCVRSESQNIFMVC